MKELKTLSSTLRLVIYFIKENVISVLMDFKKETREFDKGRYDFVDCTRLPSQP